MKIPLAKDGLIFILPLLVITIFMFLLSFYWPAIIFGLGFLFDPKKTLEETQ